MTKAILQNYLTTIFGILAGLPILVTGSGLPMTAKWTHVLLIISGLGTVGLGIVAKAFNVHSTTNQAAASQATAAASTATAIGIPGAPAMVRAAEIEVKAADVQAAGKKP